MDDFSSSEHNHNRDLDPVDPLYESDDELGAAATTSDPQPKSDDETPGTWSEEEEDAYDDDDASSDDHALTFSPSNKRVPQYEEYHDDDNHDG
jgi:hypothetical protein